MALWVTQHLAHYLNETVVCYDLGLAGRVFPSQGQKERLFIAEVVKDSPARFTRGFFEASNCGTFIAVLSEASACTDQNVMAAAVQFGVAHNRHGGEKLLKARLGDRRVTEVCGVCGAGSRKASQHSMLLAGLSA